uniref:SsrA-binding protein n=1 Tax=candidate division CPR3 bacterium TaxID=2268181 RepID=A0A7C4QXF6_UNCC3
MSTIAANKKAYHNYHIGDIFEVGIKLTGPEVKSIKNGDMSLKESFVHIENGQLFIKNMHVGAYKPAHPESYDPTRNRKLLANKKEIQILASKLDQKGLSIVPTKVYLKNGLIKLEIGVAKGKKKWDKREDIKKKDLAKESKKGMI